MRQLELIAELTPSQKERVRQWATPINRGFRYPNNVAVSNHVFGKKTRISEPLQTIEAKPNSNVEEHLDKNDYKIHDYKQGLSHPKTNPKRLEKIGKVLEKTKAPEHVKKAYINDPARAASKASRPNVVFTRHPYDVAGISTGHGFTSCMDMNKRGTGEIYEGDNYLPHDIRQGTHAAYLTHANDPTISDPIARVSIKPFVNSEGHKILRPENYTYGTAGPEFHKQVKDWSEKHFPMQHNKLYSLHKDLYPDDISRHQIKTTNVNDAINNHRGKLADLLDAIEEDKEGHKAIDPALVKNKMKDILVRKSGRHLVSNHAPANYINKVLALSEDPNAADAAARSPHLSEQGAWHLADSPHYSARSALVSHTKDKKLLEHLMKNDPHVNIKDKAEKRLRKLESGDE